MEMYLKILGFCAPILLGFGPIFMVIGVILTIEGDMGPKPALYAFGGAASLAFGSLYLLMTIKSIRVELEEIKKRGAESVAD